MHSLKWLIYVISVFYFPGADAVSDDTWHVGREDNRLVCWTQKHHKVRLWISCFCPCKLFVTWKTLHLFCVCRDEAEMEYLKIAQDLEMYGVSYFSITVSLFFNICRLLGSKLTSHWLNVQWSTLHLEFWKLMLFKTETLRSLGRNNFLLVYFHGDCV